MSRRTDLATWPRRFQMGQAASLTRAERVVLLVLVGAGAGVDLIGLLSSPDANPVHSTLSILATLTFALYIWSPLVATLALGVAVTLTFIVGNGAVGLLAAAMAAAPLLRLATTPLVVAYAAGILIANTFVAYGLGGIAPSPVTTALLLIVAAFAGSIGFALRTTQARGNRLERELLESEEREREAILAERRWIAGELHDSIAHYLTIIALHVQLLDDDAMRTESQDAIRIAARKALSDLRFVIELAEDAPRGTGVSTGDLAEAISEASAEFESAGHDVTCVGDPSDENISRGAEIILARIVRESATNILKYAGPGQVRFVLNLAPESITLQIFSPLPTTPRRELSSSGTGLNRMAERVLGVNGEFTAGPAEDAWLVSVKLPLAEIEQKPNQTSGAI